MSTKRTFRYPGTRQAMDGNTAVIMCERESTDAAGAYPITPSTSVIFSPLLSVLERRRPSKSVRTDMRFPRLERKREAVGGRLRRCPQRIGSRGSKKLMLPNLQHASGD